jgi:two-component system response regulator YesN
MAYRVLLVDDDRLDLKLLEEVVPWDELDLKVVARAHDARKALTLAAESQPEIALLDIRMPGIDGLDLCKQLKKESESLRVLFISGHEEFSYARRAIELQADGYLIKPVDIDELIERLKLVRDLVRQDRDEAIHLQEGALARVLFAPDGNGEDHSAVIRQTLPAAVAVIAAGSGSIVSDTLWRTFRAFHLKHALPVGRGRIAVLIPAADDRQARRRADRVESDLSELTDCPVCVGVGAVTGRMDGLYESYRTAERSLNRSIFFGQTGGSSALASLGPGGANAAHVRAYKNALPVLVQAVAKGDREAAGESLDELLRVARSTGDERVSRALMVHGIVELDNGLSVVDIDILPIAGGLSELSERVLSADSFAGLSECMQRVVASALEAVRRRTPLGHDTLAREVAEYITRRMAEDISLDDLATHFAYSGDYLSHLLKEETGESFRGVLTRLRMERAAKLLKSTRLLIYEISERVGFRDVAYFTRQFKKHYGVSPAQYRRDGS